MAVDLVRIDLVAPSQVVIDHKSQATMHYLLLITYCVWADQRSRMHFKEARSRLA